MADLTVWGLVVLITLSEVIINTCNFIHGNSHGKCERTLQVLQKLAPSARISATLSRRCLFLIPH